MKKDNSQNKVYQWLTQHPVWSILFITTFYCAIIAAVVFLPPIALYAPLVSMSALNAATLLAINVAITVTATLALSLMTFFSLRYFTSPKSDIFFSSVSPAKTHSSSFCDDNKIIKVDHANVDYQLQPVRVLHNGDCGFYSVYCATKEDVRNLFGQASSEHVAKYRKQGIADLLNATQKQRRPLIDEIIRCVFNPYIPGTDKKLLDAEIVSKGTDLIQAWYDAKDTFQETLILFATQHNPEREQEQKNRIEAIRAGNYQAELAHLIKKIAALGNVPPKEISPESDCDKQLQQLVEALLKDPSSDEYLRATLKLQQAKTAIYDAKRNVDEFLGNPDLQNEYITKKYQTDYLEAESARVIASVNGYNLTIWDYDRKAGSYSYSAQNDKYDMIEAPNGKKHVSFSSAATEWNLLIPVEKSPEEKTVAPPLKKSASCPNLNF